MTERPQLRLVDVQTGELVHQDERDVLIEQLEREKRSQSLRIGQLRREIAGLRMVEPEAQTILDVLGYWRERISPRSSLAPEGKRWEKTRARLREKLDDRPPLTPEELKLAVDGALLDGWHTQKGMRHRLDAEFLFRGYESVERLRDKAIGFQGQTGLPLRDLLDVASDLRFVSWKHLLRLCSCGHRRIEHAHADPSLEGRELCFMCDCPDFDEDAFDLMAEWGTNRTKGER